MVNFFNLTKVFMRLLKDTPFYWDERAQEYFDPLKKALAMAPMLSPPESLQEVGHALQTLNISNITRGRQLKYCLKLQDP